MVTVITVDNMEPIKDHPRYRQRVGLIVTVAIAFIFCILSILTAYWNQAPWVAELVVLILSAIFSIIDLLSSRLFKKKVPTWCILILDVGFCITFLVMYILTCFMARGIPQVYSSLAMLICCILHAWCIWQAIHKKLQARWAREVTFVCDKCQVRSKGKQPKWAARGGRDTDEETDYLLYRDSTDEDAVEIIPGADEVEGTSGKGKGKGKMVDEEAGA